MVVAKARPNGECGSQERSGKSGRLALKATLQAIERSAIENDERRKGDQKTEARPAIITSLTDAALVAARRPSWSTATSRRPPPGADRRGAESKQS